MTIILDGTTGITTPAINSSGDLELPGGTANGVLYLNGSKVATSGSALVFDGTNLGVGVTPSAWVGATGLQVQNAGIEGRSSANSYATFSANGYTDSGTWKYISSDFSSRYTQFQGQHLWFTAASGTAGNTISFTQAMTLTAAGDLGVGLTDPGSFGKFTVSAAGIGMHSNSTSGAAGLNFYENGSGRFSLRTLNGSAGLAFYDTFNTVERARIDASGNLGIGTSNPQYRLHVVGSNGDLFRAAGANENLYVALDSSGSSIGNGAGQTGEFIYFNAVSDYMSFWTSSTERARITSGGNFGINTSSPTTTLTVNGLLTGGFGAATTSGVTDWNDITNAVAGMGYTLLVGTATNGPGGLNYYHVLNFEYSSKNGIGNMTQIAVPYLGGSFFWRTRYSGSWSSWTTNL